MLHFGHPRKTEIAPDTNGKYANDKRQRELEYMWQMIEKEDELLRDNPDGSVGVEMDEDNLIAMFNNRPDEAFEAFNSYEEHSPEAGAWEWRDLPYDLLGTYTIRGHYEGNPTYHFSEVH